MRAAVLLLMSCMAVAQSSVGGGGVRVSGSPAANDCVKFVNNFTVTTTGGPCSAGGGSPGSPSTSVQFNDGGAFGGIPELAYDKSLKAMTGLYTDVITSQQFTGTGLNDAVLGGELGYLSGSTFRITIDGTGTPDTFKWAYDGVTIQSGIAITGTTQTVFGTTTVRFGATTGHTLNDSWTDLPTKSTFAFNSTANATVQLSTPQKLYLGAPVIFPKYTPVPIPSADDVTSVIVNGAEYDGGIAFTQHPLIALELRANSVDSGTVADNWTLHIPDPGSVGTNTNRAIKIDAGANDFGAGTSTVGKLATSANCANGASPAICGSAASGVVAVPTGTNPTLVVNTTAVTSTSRVFLQNDESATIGGTTCNTTLSTLVQPVVTARTASTSFTMQIGAVIASNPACVSYFIVN